MLVLMKGNRKRCSKCLKYCLNSSRKRIYLFKNRTTSRILRISFVAVFLQVVELHFAAKFCKIMLMLKVEKARLA